MDRAGISSARPATRSLQRWSALLVETYGRLPDYHELLQLYELRGISEEEWMDFDSDEV